MTSIFDILVLGSYSIDFIFSGMSEFPQLGKDVLSTDFKMTPGEAFIPAITMHRLGIKVGWAADFGDDEFSQFALKCAQEEGLDESLYVIHNRPYRRISVAASYPHERAFLTYYDPDPQIPAAIPALVKSQAKFVLISGLYYGPFLETGMKLIKAKRMKMVMDGNSSNGDIRGRSKECAAIKKAIKYADIFLPNAEEAKRLTSEPDLELAIRRLGELSTLVVIKDGSNGSYAYTNKHLIHIPGIPITPIDTTGAGDNFNAGFLCAFLDGLPLESCLKWGNVTGGLSTLELGGTTHKITIAEVENTLASNYP